MNWEMGRLGKPYVAIIDGFTSESGGGVSSCRADKFSGWWCGYLTPCPDPYRYQEDGLRDARDQDRLLA